MRTRNIFFVITGLLAACVSSLGLLGASVPIDNPTPAQLDHQSMSINVWWLAIAGSLVVLAIGARGLWRSRGR
ncbi:hypothetical protein [Marinobacter confluentis]|uniref:Uncharacterized protein n=1 Tax=Marinobacter confluentis TaxID=1697557 RepID=A0A4Z1BT01_9GAMM|nr:hypothetical protein [Marinobacter confluentis]TGN41155.1 hypothetical protein E5Q11_00960 [Marinobacter confluentis]